MSNHLNALQRLLPQGFAWSQDNPSSQLVGLLTALAIELDEFERVAISLLTELHPGQSKQLITDWFTLLGLPDGCFEPVTLLEQQALAWAKTTQTGGASAAYLTEQAALLGYTVQITDNYPARTQYSRTTDPLNGGGTKYTFTVTMPQQLNIRAKTQLSRTTEPLLRVSDGVVECLFARIKPAHTEAVYQYS